MKITHVLPALTKGGAERVVVDLANHATRAGHQVTILVAFHVDPAILRNELDADIPVRSVSYSAKSRLSQYINMLSWLRRNRSWLQEQDVIHCHLTYASVFGAAAKILRFFSGSWRPVIVETYHAVGMRIPVFKRWLHARLAAHRDALALMATDNYWKAFVADHPTILSAVIPNGVSMPRRNAIRRSEVLAYRQDSGIHGDCHLVVGAVGMLRPDRQPCQYLPIFAEIALNTDLDVHFLLAGGGSEIDRLRALAIDYGLEGRVHFPGLALDPQLPLSVIDVYVTLNVGPITGMAALEAALLGLPVIGIQLKADYHAGSKDWIWSSSDHSDVANRVIKLLRSTSERKTTGERQREYVRAHLTTEAMANSYYSLYCAAVESVQSKTDDSDP